MRHADIVSRADKLGERPAHLPREGLGQISPRVRSASVDDGVCLTLAGIVGFVKICVIVWAIWKKYHAVQSPPRIARRRTLTALELPSLLHSAPHAMRRRELRSKIGITMLEPIGNGRLLRKQCQAQRKLRWTGQLEQAERALLTHDSHTFYATIQQLAPKQARGRIQLRGGQGEPLDVKAEIDVMCAYWAKVYHEEVPPAEYTLERDWSSLLTRYAMPLHTTDGQGLHARASQWGCMASCCGRGIADHA